MAGVGKASHYQIQHWMDDLVNTPLWFGLMSSDPYLVLDPLTVEVTGPSYVRVAAQLYSIAFNSMTNNGDKLWPSLPPGTVVAAVAAFDASTNGNMRASLLYDSPVAYPNGGTHTVADGAWVFGLDL